VNFEAEYQKLNSAQRAAVDKIDGTVMVIAGPGTGKTQLLAMRVANILKETDTDARSVLCLTFTESAAANMTTRLSQLIGTDAYKVAVHTFHSFGSEIISRYPEYFYNGARFRPADELTTLEILDEILSGLTHDNPLSASLNGEWTYLGELSRTISDFKKAGLAPGEVSELLTQNLIFAANITLALRETFTDKINLATLESAKKLLDKAEKIMSETPRLPFSTEPTLAEIFVRSLGRALNEARATNKTKSLTEWKKVWTTKNPHDELILKDDKQSQKLLFVTDIYAKYIDAMSAHGFYDFDDMILRVIAALETNSDLKSELQETFQYVLVDEFQDTNDAQMRLLHALTDYDNQPNLMVVGDDDQAIYRFQGADISNIQQFATRFPTLTVISLNENYRSGAEILDLAGKVAAQISERLVGDDGSVKKLIKKVDFSSKVRALTAVTRESQNDFVASEIRHLIDNGVSPDEIAVIARKHQQLENLLPFLANQNIAVDYERRRDVLGSEPIQQLINLSLVVEAIARGVPTVIDEYLPQVLAHPAWNIAPADLWRISLTAHEKRLCWLDALAVDEKFAPLVAWLQEMASLSQNEPLESILDKLIGFARCETTFSSDPSVSETSYSSPHENKFSRGPRAGQPAEPSSKKTNLSVSSGIYVSDSEGEKSSEESVSQLYNYFFSPKSLRAEPEKYLNFLADLTTLRNKLREWRPDQSLKLADFLDFVREAENLDQPIVSNLILATAGRVKLLTAHKAKGLEFDYVFIIGANSEIWGGKTRARGNLLALPHNMPFRLSSDSDNERLRLLFVALTRARRNLTLTASDSDGDKVFLPLEYLLDLRNEKLPASNLTTIVEQLATAWHAPLTKTSDDLRALLSDKLEHYKLSATHLNTFLDVRDGGPEKFLLRWILRFPTARTPQAMFGMAIHTALQRAHTHLTATGNLKPSEDTLGDFVNVMSDLDFNSRDRDFYTKRGVDALTVFLSERTPTFTPEQKVEQHFDAVIDGMRLTGLIDLIDVDKKNKILTLTDYKTGKAPRGWRGVGENEKLKLHRYRRQLMFYKLLIENSREFSGWTAEKGILEFVEPLDGQLVKLELEFDREEMIKFVELVKKVWTRIQTLDLPPIDNFTPNLAGILDFEKFLLEKQ